MRPEQHLSFEMLRWGYANIPGAILYYSSDLNMDMEDLGIVCAIFYAYEQSRPLLETGVRVGEVLRCCSALSNNKLSRRLNRMKQKGLIDIEDGKNRAFAERIIHPAPLLNRLGELVMRDHPLFEFNATGGAEPTSDNAEVIAECRRKIAQLERRLAEYQLPGNAEVVALPVGQSVTGGKGNGSVNGNDANGNGDDFRRVAEFISCKTGALLSTKMEGELKKWLNDFDFTPEFLFCVLELSFERKIDNPQELSRIARDLKECGISSVEGLQLYFNNNIDMEKNRLIRTRAYDPEIAEFGAFTGIDMNASARRQLYYKWRFDWGFTHLMIMKAGELMCIRTRDGGLQYVDSVLNNWLSNEIRTPAEADKQINEHKSRSRASKPAGRETAAYEPRPSEHKIYVPPDLLEELKAKSKA